MLELQHLAICYWACWHAIRLVVLVVPVLGEFVVVDDIEENHSTRHQLEEWSDTGTLRLHILVLPSPPSCKSITIDIRLNPNAKDE